MGSAAGGSVVGGWGKRGRGKRDGKTKKKTSVVLPATSQKINL